MFDTTNEELKMIQNALKAVIMDEYDGLIQLCDSLAGAECANLVLCLINFDIILKKIFCKRHVQ